MAASSVGLAVRSAAREQQHARWLRRRPKRRRARGQGDSIIRQSSYQGVWRGFRGWRQSRHQLQQLLSDSDLHTGAVLLVRRQGNGIQNDGALISPQTVGPRDSMGLGFWLFLFWPHKRVDRSRLARL